MLTWQPSLSGTVSSPDLETVDLVGGNWITSDPVWLVEFPPWEESAGVAVDSWSSFFGSVGQCHGDLG